MPDKQDVEVIIRQAEVGDARAILGMLSQIRQESPYVVLADNADDVEAQVTIIEQYDQHPHALMLVSEVDGQLVGFATVQPQNLPDLAHVAEIGVCLIAEYWGYGIGSLLMETMLDFAQGWDCVSCIWKSLRITCQPSVFIRNSTSRSEVD